MMDKKTENWGKAAAEWLQKEVDRGELVRVLVAASDLQDLLKYVKALEEPPVKKEYDVYLRGEWYNTILKVDLTSDEVALLRGLSERSEGVAASVDVEPHNPEYPLPGWMGYVRK